MCSRQIELTRIRKLYKLIAKLVFSFFILRLKFFNLFNFFNFFLKNNAIHKMNIILNFEMKNRLIDL